MSVHLYVLPLFLCCNCISIETSLEGAVCCLLHLKQNFAIFYCRKLMNRNKLLWKQSTDDYLRAATCKYHLQLCKIEKSKILKLCHNKGFRSLITEILVSVRSRKYFSVAATFPSRTLQGQANRLKIPLLYAHSLEIIKY